MLPQTPAKASAAPADGRGASSDSHPAKDRTPIELIHPWAMEREGASSPDSLIFGIDRHSPNRPTAFLQVLAVAKLTQLIQSIHGVSRTLRPNPAFSGTTLNFSLALLLTPHSIVCRQPQDPNMQIDTHSTSNGRRRGCPRRYTRSEITLPVYLIQNIDAYIAAHAGSAAQSRRRRNAFIRDLLEYGWQHRHEIPLIRRRIAGAPYTSIPIGTLRRLGFHHHPWLLEKLNELAHRPGKRDYGRNALIVALLLFAWDRRDQVPDFSPLNSQRRDATIRPN